MSGFFKRAQLFASLFLPCFYPDSILQGTWAGEEWAGNTYGSSYNNSTTNDGDGIRWTRFLSAGAYKFALEYRRNTNQGIIDLEVGGSVKDSIDAFGASAYMTNITNVTVPVSGLQNIDLVINGKNGGSSDFGMKVFQLRIWRVS